MDILCLHLVFVPSGGISLPLSGTYEIRLIRGSQIFVGEIEL